MMLFIKNMLKLETKKKTRNHKIQTKTETMIPGDNGQTTMIQEDDGQMAAAKEEDGQMAAQEDEDIGQTAAAKDDGQKVEINSNSNNYDHQSQTLIN